MATEQPLRQQQSDSGLTPEQLIEQHAISALTMLANGLLTLPEALTTFEVTEADLRIHEPTWRRQVGFQGKSPLPPA